eukprot:m.31553 g.31553  ORF g.31553 m.31553 type:complete len:63 (+) comp9430_c0_seq1:252-440(+)
MHARHSWQNATIHHALTALYASNHPTIMRSIHVFVVGSNPSENATCPPVLVFATTSPGPMSA